MDYGKRRYKVVNNKLVQDWTGRDDWFKTKAGALKAAGHKVDAPGRPRKSAKDESAAE